MFGLSLKEKMYKALKSEFIEPVQGSLICFDQENNIVSDTNLCYLVEQGNTIRFYDAGGDLRLTLPFIFKREYSLKTASRVISDSAAVSHKCLEGFEIIKMAKEDRSIVYGIYFPESDGRKMTVTIERAF